MYDCLRGYDAHRSGLEDCSKERPLVGCGRQWEGVLVHGPGHKAVHRILVHGPHTGSALRLRSGLAGESYSTSRLAVRELRHYARQHNENRAVRPRRSPIARHEILVAFW
jgi:hypothetical protein